MKSHQQQGIVFGGNWIAIYSGESIANQRTRHVEKILQTTHLLYDKEGREQPVIYVLFAVLKQPEETLTNNTVRIAPQLKNTTTSVNSSPMVQ